MLEVGDLVGIKPKFILDECARTGTITKIYDDGAHHVRIYSDRYNTYVICFFKESELVKLGPETHPEYYI